MIYTLSEDGSTARISELSRLLKVAPASVTEMLQKLAKHGLVDYTLYRGAALTEERARIASG
jgi:DtxR family Mn-dependent transcriptional regulator